MQWAARLLPKYSRPGWSLWSNAQIRQRFSSGQTRLRKAAATRGGYLPAPKPQFDFRAITDHRNRIVLDLVHRRSPVPPEVLDEIGLLEDSTRQQRIRLAALQSEQAALGERIRLSRVKGLDRAAETSELQAAAGAIREQVSQLLQHLDVQEARLSELACSLPNSSHPSSPIGQYESSRVIDVVNANSGNAPEAAELVAAAAKPDRRRDHLDILTELGWLSFEAGQRTTGSSFPVLKGPGAMLELALTQYALATALRSGWQLALGPDVVQVDLAERCGFAPRDAGEANQTYFVTSALGDRLNPSMCLAATAEIPLIGSLHSAILPDSVYPEFPSRAIKKVGLGRAFRAEAGARGTDSRGLYRVHQFAKVELVAVTSHVDGASDAMLGEMVMLQKKILAGLRIPFR